MSDISSEDSRLVSVVVYASGAVCRRRALIRARSGPGPFRIALGGLPLALDPHSLRAAVVSGPQRLRVLDVRREVEAALPSVEDLSPLKSACDEAEEAADAAGAARAALAAQVEHTAALRAVPPAPRRGDPPRHAPADALLALADFVDTRLGELQQRLLAAEDAEREARREAEIARRRLRAASGALPTEQVSPSTTVVLTLDQAGTAGPEEGPSGQPDQPEPEIELELEYGVPGATWTPTYHLRLDGIHSDTPGGSLAMRAVVAQRTGEDWTGVRLGLSTADLRRRTELPELRSLRLGRRQAEVAPMFRREPPSGLAELFTGYDAFPKPAAAEAQASAAMAGGAAAGLLEEDADLAMDTFSVKSVRTRSVGSAGPTGGPVPFPPAMAAPPAPAPGGPAYAQPMQAMRAPMAPSGGYGGPPREAKKAFGAAAAQQPEPDQALRDLVQLALAGPDEPAAERGLLRPGAAGSGAVATEYRRRAESVARLALPPRSVPVRSSAGSFDHRYDTAATVDVPADGAWHTVPVLEFPVELAAEHICVPAVDPRVYAAVRLGNTSPHALLAGAAEVTVDGAYLMTVQLPTLAPGQHRRVGIGVVESVQVARHTRMRESTAGLRGGTVVLEHSVEIELVNRLGRPVTVEVRERVPVGGDKDVKVEEQQANPPWTVVPPEQDEQHQRGMRVWRVTLEPHAKQQLNGGYAVRIPAAKAVVDGNRRL
ncbi:DUF4139 domain-containing protein [Streptacidiphilus sp. N1-10]|uniref:DUF4139 domain-containing protein n=1 Tax=Streptacidiphilus jeojiensis TaxID=3229225 RepID=A0ABV6XSI9_9ACTN